MNELFSPFPTYPFVLGPPSTPVTPVSDTPSTHTCVRPRVTERSSVEVHVLGLGRRGTRAKGSHR